MRIAIVEPYLGGSHAAWAQGYQAHSGHQVALISHPDRFWKWRMHGAHVTLAEQFRQEVATGGSCDVVVASSMLNTAGFLGLARQAVGRAGVALFMHENQLGYPLSPRDRVDLTYPMINWTSMVAADLVVFNSEYHRSQWFEMVPRFLGQFPDCDQRGLISGVAARSRVLPVGVDLGRFDEVERFRGPVPRILFNQRWEYDKGPAELAAALIALEERGIEFEVVLAGEQTPNDLPEFGQLRRRFGRSVVQFGFVPADEYARLIASCDIVVSTAHHEFFGIAITEAIYAGAFPVLPDRLVYPERIPPQFHERCLYRTKTDLVDKLAWAAANRAEAQTISDAIRPAMATTNWSLVAPRYDDVFGALA